MGTLVGWSRRSILSVWVAVSSGKWARLGRTASRDPVAVQLGRETFAATLCPAWRSPTVDRGFKSRLSAYRALRQ